MHYLNIDLLGRKGRNRTLIFGFGDHYNTIILPTYMAVNTGVEPVSPDRQSGIITDIQIHHKPVVFMLSIQV